MDTISWLLDSDPAICWQAMHYLTDASDPEVSAVRAHVAREGLGAEIFASQGADGAWHRPGAPDWLPTLFTLQLLRSTGIDPSDPAVESMTSRLQAGFRWHESFGAKPFFEGEVEPCINGGVLALGSHFGHPPHDLACRLAGEQLEDGGWNCDAPKSQRSSFHTTICVLEGLLEYERAVGASTEITKVRQRGEEYLLKRALFRRLSTGEVANPEFLQLAFPTRYHHDLLRGLDYFRSSGVAPDPRMKEAVNLVTSKRQNDGRWLLEASYAESLAVPFDEIVGNPSRWNTLRAMRVLRWYNAAQGDG